MPVAQWDSPAEEPLYPIPRAVEGLICITPRSPALPIKLHLNPLSCLATASANPTGTPCLAASLCTIVCTEPLFIPIRGVEQNNRASTVRCFFIHFSIVVKIRRDVCATRAKYLWWRKAPAPPPCHGGEAQALCAGEGSSSYGLRAVRLRRVGGSLSVN